MTNKEAVMKEEDLDIRDTYEWINAQDLFNRVYAHRPVFSIIVDGPAPGASWVEIDYILRHILEGFPQFFPAMFQRGEYLLRIGKTSEAEEFIEKAFNAAFDILKDEEEFSETITQRTENLGELLRYDLAAKYMERATRLFPDNAAFYDYLAFYLLQLPGTDKFSILNIQQKALDIEPDNDFFINNLGWIYLVMGNYGEAEEHFQQAIDYSSESTAVENLETTEYMKEHGMTYSRYLLRPTDKNKLDDLRQCVDFDEVARMCKAYNSDKVEAFKIHHLQKNTLPPHEILDALYPLKEFLKTTHKSMASGEGIFLFENIDHFFEKSDSFISQFIDGKEIAGQPLPDTTLDSLAIFYDFLQETNVIVPGQYTRVMGRINLLKSVTRIPPMPGVSWQEIDRGLEELIAETPRYYPVLFKWGEYMLGIGRNPEGEKFIEKAFTAVIDVFTKEEYRDEEEEYEEEGGRENLREIFIQKTETLEELLRYDLAAKYIEKATRLFPGEAIYYDFLASYLLQAPGSDEKRIIEIQQKALELEPDNDSFITNLGWIYLMMGNYEQAQEYFRQAGELNSDNTDAVENLEMAEYMEDHRMTYLQYLLHADPGETREFSGAGEFEDVSKSFEESNADKLKAFEMLHLQKQDLPPHEILNILNPLEIFLDIIYESLEDGAYFFFENIDLLLEKVRYFTYQFLDRTEVEGEQALDTIVRSITDFYDFLRQEKVVSQDQFNRVAEQINLIKVEFSGKLDHYYRICDDFTLDAEEKEERVNELFGI
ncbi:MAG: tetratricopeptide repeat protein [Candidatus Aminicenantes bacterium]|nr:tetratricopeptide repeat protein [Candidatus Aminicenantes bacterium]